MNTGNILLYTSFFIRIAVAVAGTDPSTPRPSRNPVDTTSFHFRVSDKSTMTYTDSIAFIPAYDLYCQWDTVTIHPAYNFDPAGFKDTVRLILTGKNSTAFAMPRIGKTNSNFGLRQRSPHFGVDIHLVTGDTVLSAFDGMVRIAKRNSSYGNVVIIRHRNGLETIYAHLSRLLVKADQYVKAGDVIGLGGNTGHSYGSHLHFEIRYKGEPLNPNELISFEKHTLLADTVSLSYKSFEFYDNFLGGKSYPANAKSLTSLQQRISGKGAPFYYTIKQGDTLSSIARKYGKTPAQLCKINNISLTTILHVGKVIRCG